MSKNKHNEEIVIESEEDINDKTIKIVGFNKAEDEYLEILEGTQSMSELDVLKELQVGSKMKKKLRLKKIVMKICNQLSQ